MKHFWVFNCPAHYSRGGMGDFVGAFDTYEEALCFANRSLDMADVDIVDISVQLSWPSPRIPTQEEFDTERKRKRVLHEERMKDPLYAATYALTSRMERDMYGGGDE